VKEAKVESAYFNSVAVNRVTERDKIEKGFPNEPKRVSVFISNWFFYIPLIIYHLSTS